MSGTSVRFRLPPASLFKFPPDPEPRVLPAPDPSESFRTFAAPFKIDQDLYNAVFSAYIPITIASIYAVTVLYMNSVNVRRGGKPYAISRTSGFHVFVVFHNIALAIFSGLVFWAMLRSLAHTWPSYREYPFLGKLWPGIRTQHGFAGAADALCKMHGPRGFGDAATYNTKKALWEIKNKMIRLGSDGSPDPTDLGRLWNEGLAFWGWFFYLSKFYEVVDTAIIILKGKRSSTLQTYHHTGAMFCMWAGMRYMSSPIWMFVWINSGIHAMMYTYYALSALGFKVPRRLKKSLTTMQIGQFLVGFTFAAGHLFVEYTIPSHFSYAGRYGIKQAASAVSAAAATIATAVADPTATAGAGAWLKKLAYRAAGEEGLAENVRNQYGEVFGPEADHVQSTLDQMRRGPSFDTIPCIDTTGQSFAIWLNLIYLAPLTWLFLRFFIRSYSRRTSVSTRHPTRREQVSKSADDAAHGVERKVDSVGRSAEDGLSELAKMAKKKSADNRRISETIEKFENGLSKGYEQAISQGKQLSDQAVKGVESVKERVGKWRDLSPSKEGDGSSSTPRKVKDEAQFLVDEAKDAVKQSTEKAKEAAQVGAQKAQNGVKQAKQSAGESADKAVDKAQQVVDAAQETASQPKEAVKNEVKESRDDSKDSAKDAQVSTKDAVNQAAEATGDSVTQATNNAQSAKDEVKEKTMDVQEGTKEAAEAATSDFKEKAEDVVAQEANSSQDIKDEADDSTLPGPEESGVLVERHDEAADTDDNQPSSSPPSETKDEEPEQAPAPTPADEDKSQEESAPPESKEDDAENAQSKPDEAVPESKKDDEKEGEPAPDEPASKDEAQGLSTTDSTAEGAKSYADELK